MARVQTSETAADANDAMRATAAVQQNFEQIARASEHFMRGMTNAAVRQMELGQSLIEGGMQDFNLIAQSRTPESFFEAEIEVLRRRAQRLAAAMQAASEDIREAWGEALQMTGVGASPPASAGESGKPVV